MSKTRCHQPHLLRGPLPSAVTLIIGAGHFGAKAARQLSKMSEAPILVIDKNKERLAQIRNGDFKKILCDGPKFLAENFHLLDPSNRIVPAAPIHLAFEWLKEHIHEDWRVRQSDIPAVIKPSLPHSWPGSDGSLLISYADFLCPEDCPEPAGYCLATGKKRATPLYALLGGLTVDDHNIHVIRSRQIAPGLGGYEVDALRELADRVKRGGKGKWLVATACKCHGTLTATEISPAKKYQTGLQDGQDLNPDIE